MSAEDLSQGEAVAHGLLQVHKKRKRESQLPQDEIEIDVSAPEPLSKKVLRKAKKKGTTAPIKGEPQSQDENTSTREKKNDAKQTDSDSVAQKKSEHGIWIGNLPWSATKDDLRRFLISNSTIDEEHITRVHMPAPKDAVKTEITNGPDRRSKPQNKGFAYVDFSSELAKSQAIALSEKLLTGRAVLIKDALSFEGRPKPTDEDSGGKLRSGKPPTRRIFVGNLAFDATKEDVEQHFARCGHVEDVFLATFEDSGKCKGYGWVMFDGIGAASAAVQGWVNLDTEAEEEEEDVDAEGVESRQHSTRKRKPRKWWVNRMRGRPLRVEYAEDPTTRYNKRFGKEAKATRQAVGEVLGEDGPEGHSNRTKGNEVDDTDNPPDGMKPDRSRDLKGYKRIGANDGSSSRILEKMRGNIVVAEGKKTTFT